MTGGSFFEAVPMGGDAYIPKSILHDWEDEPCRRILHSCRQTVADGTALLVIERDLGHPNQDPAAKFSDLNMLVALMGQERTPEEYAALFPAAGFRYVSFTPSAVDTGVNEGIAA